MVSSSAASTVQAGSLSIGAATIVEGNDGVAQLAFTVTRVGGSEGAVGAAYTINLIGSATAADLASAALGGAISLAAGQSTATILVPIQGDTLIEGNKTLSVSLSAPTGGATIGTATAIGTIVNDDYPPAANVFINEFSYDPVGADTGEFIGVAGVAGTSLNGCSLVLYNGNGGASYAEKHRCWIVPAGSIHVEHRSDAKGNRRCRDSVRPPPPELHAPVPGFR